MKLVRTFFCEVKPLMISSLSREQSDAWHPFSVRIPTNLPFHPIRNHAPSCCATATTSQALRHRRQYSQLFKSSAGLSMLTSRVRYTSQVIGDIYTNYKHSMPCGPRDTRIQSSDAIESGRISALDRARTAPCAPYEHERRPSGPGVDSASGPLCGHCIPVRSGEAFALLDLSGK